MRRSYEDEPPPPPKADADYISPAFSTGYISGERAISWIWPGAIPARSLVIIEGRKSTGKSTVVAAIAAAYAGGPSPPGATIPTGRRVLWASSEDDWDSVVLPRIVGAGGSPDAIGRVSPVDRHGTPRRLVIPDDVELLRQVCLDAHIGLIVLDPFVSLASPAIDLRIEQSARLYLDPLAEIARDCGLVVLLVRHLRKGLGGDAREAGLGSVAVANAARSMLRCDEHPHQRGLRVLSVVACNYGQRMATRAYSIETSVMGSSCVQWGAELDLDADAIAEGRGSEGERGEWTDADRLLISVIGQGWAPVQDLLRECEMAGISPRVLRRAKERLGCASRRVQAGPLGRWEWGPPPAGWPDLLAGIVSAPPPAEPGAPCPTRPPRRSRKNAENSQGAQGAPRARVPPVSPKKRRKKDDSSDAPTA